MSESDAPRWFVEAVAAAPVTRMIKAVDACLEVLSWGDPGKPTLLLLHGKEASADWWRFTAPILAQDFHVLAPSWSGMGHSSWRDAYRLSQFSREAAAVLDDVGASNAFVVAHSFGGYAALGLAKARPDLVRSVMIVDTPVDPDFAWRGPPPRGVADRVHADFEAAVARFRLSPSDLPAPAWMERFLGRHSLRRTEDGWCWKFDPTMWRRFCVDEAPGFDFPAPVWLLYGARSSVLKRELAQRMAAATPRLRVFDIPCAGHHVFVDRPLAFVEALRALTARCLERHP